MYQVKKIGVFISHIYGDYQSRLLEGITSKAEEYGYRVEIFATNDGENLGSYGPGEAGILEIPMPGNYDGFILASGTYLLSSLKENIVSLLRNSFHCPVIDINQKPSPFPRVVLENNSPVRDLVLHLGRVHGCRKFFYLGNSSEPFFNDKRRFYFQEGLKELGLGDSLPARDCDGTEAGLKRLLEELKADNTLPEAFVCYNDRLALYTISLLHGLGIRVPEDVAVTGLDTLEFGQRTSPVLTSVTFPIDKMGEKAMELLSDLFHGKAVPEVTEVNAVPSIGASCGCPPQNPPDSYSYTAKLERRIAALESGLIQNTQMSANLLGVDSLDDGIELIAGFVKELDGCRDFFLCLYDGWDNVSGHIRELTHTGQEAIDSDAVLLKLAIRDGKRLPECTFTRRSILPGYLYGGSSVYIYAPLSFGKQSFGYLALSFADASLGYDFSFLPWLMNVNIMLKRLCDRKKLGLLVSHLESLYARDELTGLLNQQGFRLTASRVFEQAIADGSSVCAILFDLDGLKRINETFGHDEGDFAIQVLARALETSVDAPCVCTRCGGDEFRILAPGYTEQDARKLMGNLQKYLDNYNRLHNKKYLIRASGGYSIRTPASPEELSEMFRAAGQAMYEAKRQRNQDILKG